MIHNSLSTTAVKFDALLASGAILRVEPKCFLEILGHAEPLLVVKAKEKHLFRELNKYITSYMGFIFYTETVQPLLLPDTIELLEAVRIWTPGP